ncbi:MAG: S8 family serine peptidase [Verrucomicrobia bacterium]|nr:S8 family serine peptidase [Verrucomicrobiota bacterium]
MRIVLRHSASAPHAAAIAALLLSYNPAMSPAEVRLAMESTALDIEAQASIEIPARAS